MNCDCLQNNSYVSAKQLKSCQDIGQYLRMVIRSVIFKRNLNVTTNTVAHAKGTQPPTPSHLTPLPPSSFVQIKN